MHAIRSIALPCLLALTAFAGTLLAHPGPVDSRGGHYTNPVKRTGYHRHSNPLYGTDYADEQKAAQEALRRNPNIVDERLRHGPAHAATPDGEPSPLQKLLAERRAVHEATAAAEQADVATLDSRLARILRREGRNLYVVNTGLFQIPPDARQTGGFPAAIYQRRQADLVLVGRARVIDASSDTVLAVSMAHDGRIEATGNDVTPYYLALDAVGGLEDRLTPEQWQDFLAGRVWRGMDVQVLRAMFGRPTQMRTATGPWGSEEVYRFQVFAYLDGATFDPARGTPEPVLDLVSNRTYHVRNGALVYWKETHK